jgi:hypothetical protein
MVDAYDDPEGFRISLNATIQTLRNVTFVLQKEHRGIPNFETWYAAWRDRMKADEVLRWSVEARNSVVKQGDLETTSQARVSLIAGWGHNLPVAEFEVPPMLPTEVIADLFATKLLPPELQKLAVLVVERRWVAKTLPNWELIDALAHCFGILAAVVFDAHAQAGPDFIMPELDEAHSYPGIRPTCMVATSDVRSVMLSMQTRQRIQYGLAEIEWGPSLGERAAKKYGIAALTDNIRDDVALQNPIDPIEYAVWVVEQAKRILSKDKYHQPMVFLFDGSGDIHHHALEMPEYQMKYVLWQRIADEVERLRAIGLVTVGEVWIGTIEEARQGIRPSESKHRKEALDVVAATSDGRTRDLIVPFRRRLGRIVFEPVNDVTNPVLPFLVPVWETWKRMGYSVSPEQHILTSLNEPKDSPKDSSPTVDTEPPAAV